MRRSSAGRASSTRVHTVYASSVAAEAAVVDDAYPSPSSHVLPDGAHDGHGQLPSALTYASTAGAARTNTIDTSLSLSLYSRVECKCCCCCSDVSGDGGGGGQSGRSAVLTPPHSLNSDDAAAAASAAATAAAAAAATGTRTSTTSNSGNNTAATTCVSTPSSVLGQQESVMGCTTSNASVSTPRSASCGEDDSATRRGDAWPCSVQTQQTQQQHEQQPPLSLSSSSHSTAFAHATKLHACQPRRETTATTAAAAMSTAPTSLSAFDAFVSDEAQRGYNRDVDKCPTGGGSWGAAVHTSCTVSAHVGYRAQRPSLPQQQEQQRGREMRAGEVATTPARQVDTADTNVCTTRATQADVQDSDCRTRARHTTASGAATTSAADTPTVSCSSFRSSVSPLSSCLADTLTTPPRVDATRRSGGSAVTLLCDMGADSSGDYSLSCASATVAAQDSHDRGGNASVGGSRSGDYHHHPSSHNRHNDDSNNTRGGGGGGGSCCNSSGGGSSGGNSRLSRCRLKMRSLTAPAFDLKPIEEAQDCSALLADVCNAARCDPLSKITSYLYLGTWRDASDEALLRSHGITYVLNVAKEVNAAPPTAAWRAAHEAHGTPVAPAATRVHAGEGAAATAMVCASIPMADCHHQDLTQHFETAFAFIEQARCTGQRVLVHCRRGISRSAAIVIAYLMATQQFSYASALDYVMRRRSCVSLNLAFQEHLAEYTPDARWMHTRHAHGGGDAHRPHGRCATHDEPHRSRSTHRHGHRRGRDEDDNDGDAAAAAAAAPATSPPDARHDVVGDGGAREHDRSSHRIVSSSSTDSLCSTASRGSTGAVDDDRGGCAATTPPCATRALAVATVWHGVEGAPRGDAHASMRHCARCCAGCCCCDNSH